MNASKTIKRLVITVAAAAALTGCGYNDFQRLDEESGAAWSEVLNQYQRQALDTARCAPRTLT